MATCMTIRRKKHIFMKIVLTIMLEAIILLWKNVCLKSKKRADSFKKIPCGSTSFLGPDFQVTCVTCNEQIF